MNKQVILWIVYAALVLPVLVVPGEASAAGPMIVTGAQREAIKSQPIETRPMRRGHIYGNTVRRLNARRR